MMRGRRIISVAIAMASGALLLAQTRPPQATAGTGLILGRAVDSAGAPVQHATVSLTGPLSSTVITDDEGEFYFTALPKGEYGIRASKPGYLDGASGRRQPNAAPTVLALGAGQRRTDVTIAMWKLASVTGVVTDEKGAPLVGAVVRVLQKAIVAGHWRLEPATVGGWTFADDRGQYRVYGIPEGEYVFEVSAPALMLSSRTVDGSVDARSWIYPSAYFPVGASGPRNTVTLAAGDALSHIDFQSKPIAAFRVAGTVVGGPTSGQVMAEIRPDDANAITSRLPDDTIRRDGTFAAEPVPPGRYVYRVSRIPLLPVRPFTLETPVFQSPMTTSTGARRPDPIAPPPPSPTWFGSQSITVGSSDVAGVSVALQPASSISGTFIFDGIVPPPTDAELRQRFVPIFEPADGIRTIWAPDAPAAVTDRQFVMSNLAPGRYVMRVAEHDARWRLRRVTVDGRDVLWRPIEIGAGEARRMVVEFTDRRTSMHGTITGGRGPGDSAAYLLLFPEDATLWVDYGGFSPRMIVLTVNSDGTYDADIPAGSYRVLAISNNPGSGWQDPARLARLSELARRVAIREGDRIEIDLHAQVIK